MYLKEKYFIPVLFVVLSFISVDSHSKIPIKNPYITLIVHAFFAIYIILYCLKKNFFFDKNYILVSFFYFYSLVGAIRGCFVAENYYDWKNLMNCSFSMAIFLYVFYFRKPQNISLVLYHYLLLVFPVFFLGYIFILYVGGYHYFLTPIFLVGCFLHDLPKRCFWLCFCALVIMFFADFSARTQVISVFVTLFFALLLYIYNWGNKYKVLVTRSLKYLSLIFLGLTFVLLFFGISGLFNVFQYLEDEGQHRYIVKSETIGGEIQELDVGQDTRTHIYTDVINSAIDNDYVWLGRTLARGNDTTIGLFSDQGFMLYKRYERFANEIGMLNIFTWLGLVGVILYGSIFIYSSYVGYTKSKSIYVKIISSMVAFHFLWGWVEDYPAFTIHTFVNWMYISICLSPEFREMDDDAFRQWIQSIFYKQDKSYIV